ERGVPVVRGMGELHLEIVAERLRRRSGLRVNVGRPTVTSRYTVRRRGTGEAEVQAVFGGGTHRASARVLLEPAPEPASGADEGVLVEAAEGLQASPSLVEAARHELRLRITEGLREGGAGRAMRVELQAFRAAGLPEAADALAL